MPLSSNTSHLYVKLCLNQLKEGWPVNLHYRKFNWLYLLVFIIVVEGIGSLSALFAGNIQQHYNSLTLPVLSPPDYLFGIVWPILYALIGFSGYLIFLHTTKANRATNYTLFLLQLFINFAWSILFFNYNAYWIGFLVIIVLDLLVLLCIGQFYKTSQLASLLLVPYLIWIVFASYLTIGVAILN